MKLVKSYNRYALRVTFNNPPRPSGTPPFKRRGISATILLLCFSVLLPLNVAYGQTSTHEKPVSLLRSIPPLTLNEQTQKIMPNLDMSSIEKEDEEDRVNGIIPRFGYKHEASFNLNNSGEWVELPNGDKIWRLSIVCPNATSINLLYDRFWIPAGAKFFIYNSDYSTTLGAFTSKNNKGNKEENKRFGTGLMYGDNITLEYFVPKEVEDVGIISICDVVHGYRGFGSTDKRGGVCLNCSHEKNINVVCAPSFINEKDAVVLVIGNGNRYFTGSLVNTTANEIHDRYYILTYWDLKYGYPEITSWGFYWHYESYACNPNQPNNQPPLIYTQGASAVAKSRSGKFALLELEEDPGLEWDIVPYYLGWDRSGTTPTGENTIIHHPEGDIKKIASTTHRVLSALHTVYGAWDIDGGFYDGAPPIVPTMGSEGAPLLNSDRKLIGHYHSQYPVAYCGPLGCNELGVICGKFSWVWDNDSIASGRLKEWLDPLNTGAVTLNGRRGDCKEIIRLHHTYPLLTYHAVQKIISKQIIQSGVSTTYKAGEEIVLEDGFHAEAGSTFHAKIEEHTECTPPKTNSPSQNNGHDDEFAFQESKSQSIQHQFSYELYLHPNPNRGTFQIETNFPLSEISQLKITNTLGLNVFEAQRLISNEIQLPNSVSGLYFVVMVLKDGTVLTQKMMVQR